MRDGWRKLPIGAIIPKAGSAEDFPTGDWRSERPIFHPDKCIQCLICFIYCPDSAIKVEDGKVVGFDYDYCKGCGICARECPPKASAITMEREMK
ncbi:MAG TPA: 4Fe-4S dicluster domain-containing protein [bacterium (Candidatus Stahlbacteria)]|nr:4Fe-4S dicluster domain-containing protein [Candidatus Stahlbacteria bacterium]